ncbi:hypothetical protein SynMITS9220_00886 [Synechococcus sp. MIT S9220]|nr:hypothetical protein SynMITS9220_00886 [Synechococcus sp. MIT S9220]
MSQSRCAYSCSCRPEAQMGWTDPAMDKGDTMYGLAFF